MSCGQRNVNYELIYVLLAVLVICLLTIFGSSIQRLFNNLVITYTLGEFETTFTTIQHPAGTERLVLRKLAGNMAADDKGCDFFVGEMRRYEVSPEEITATYANQTLPDVGDLHILFIAGGAFPPDKNADLPEALNDLAEWNLAQDQTHQPLYLIYILVLDYQTGGISDCR